MRVVARALQKYRLIAAKLGVYNGRRLLDDPLVETVGRKVMPTAIAPVHLVVHLLLTAVYSFLRISIAAIVHKDGDAPACCWLAGLLHWQE